MNINRFIAVALAAAFAVTAAAAENKDEKKFKLGLEKVQLIKKKGLKKENAELKKQVAELKNKPLAKPAHEEHESSVKMQKTGDKGLDRLASRFSKK